MADAAERLRSADYEVVVDQRAGEPAVIESTVAEASVDLLVMGAYGHSRMRQLNRWEYNNGDDTFGEAAGFAFSLVVTTA